MPNVGRAKPVLVQRVVVTFQEGIATPKLGALLTATRCEPKICVGLDSVQHALGMVG